MCNRRDARNFLLYTRLVRLGLFDLHGVCE